MAGISVERSVAIYRRLGLTAGPTVEEPTTDTAGDALFIGLQFSVTRPCWFVDYVGWTRSTPNTSLPTWKLWDDKVAGLEGIIWAGSVNTIPSTPLLTPLKTNQTYTLAVRLAYPDAQMSARPIKEEAWNYIEDWAYIGSNPFNAQEHVEKYVGDTTEQQFIGFNKNQRPSLIGSIVSKYITHPQGETLPNPKPVYLWPSANVILGDFILTLVENGVGVSSVVSPPQVNAGIAQFNITLPEIWRIKDMKEWEIQVATSEDNANWTDWRSLVVLSPKQITYAHTNVDLNLYYRYRYQTRTRALQSEWSTFYQAGKPVTIQIDQIPVGDEDPDIGPGDIGEEELANEAVKPNHINQTANSDFIFPDEVSGKGVRARTDGFIFPDGSVQSTAVTSGNPISQTIINAKGDLIVGVTDDTAARFPIGTDGQVLSVNDSATNKLEWIEPPVGGGGSEVDATVRGIVNADGTIAYGTGFTVNKLGTGEYRVTFSTPFATVPSVVGSTRPGGGTVTFWRHDTEETTTSAFRCSIRDNSGATVNIGFHFIAAPAGAISLHAQEGWHEVGATGEPGFQNGSNYGSGYDTVAFKKNIFGRVSLKGLVQAADGVSIFTLPLDYRPSLDKIFSVRNGSSTGRIEVFANGQVRTSNGATSSWSLEGIEFDVGTPAPMAVPVPETIKLIGGTGQPAFQNGWINIGGGRLPAGFYKDPFGIVHVQGTLNGLSATNHTAFTLPVGYRPPGQVQIPTQYWTGGATGWETGNIYVLNTGEVQLLGKLDAFVARDYYGLDHVSFRV